MTERVEKSQTDRVNECLAILSKLQHDIGVPADNISICVLKKRMKKYWHDGRLQEDRIPLVGSDRYILYRFPRWADQIVEITLRKSAITFHSAPSDLEAEAAQ
jgi:hypothetical protein